MNEFFREVDEEYRRDRIAQIWQRWSGAIVAVIVLAVVAVAGWRYYQHDREQKAQAAAARFYEIERLAAENKDEEAKQALRDLSGAAPDGYRLLARLRLAAETGKTDPAEGAKAFDALAADASVPPVLQDLARLRGAILRLDGEPDAARQALERIATPTNPFRHTAREMLALVALRGGDIEAAGRYVDQIAQDNLTPQALRGRLDIYSALVAGGPVQVTP